MLNYALVFLYSGSQQNKQSYYLVEQKLTDREYIAKSSIFVWGHMELGFLSEWVIYSSMYLYITLNQKKKKSDIC